MRIPGQCNISQGWGGEPANTNSCKFAIMSLYYQPIRCIRPVTMPSCDYSQRVQELELDLPRFRKRAGVSLDQIAQTTKISSRFLEAIERERFEQLPGGIFTTSYLRQYALAIGYDEDALVAFYEQKVKGSEPPAKPPQAETRSGRLLGRWWRTAMPTAR